MDSSNLRFWEQITDGNLTFRWENKTMYVIIQVFGLALSETSDIGQVEEFLQVD